ncbi:hypothetical protein MRB53_016139 [Persea americana]|uniref:Uncharacterized protein n=1 Tax=Persea americana TaxID=3435 RepID=A0ACC2M1B4_PERAE|nr:hypothetical protein MRB53_016139 [Persea americana]
MSDMPMGKREWKHQSSPCSQGMNSGTPLQAVSTVSSDLSRLAHYAPALHHHCIGTTSHLFVLLLILIYLVSFFPALAALPTLSSSSPSSRLHDDSQERWQVQEHGWVSQVNHGSEIAS